MDAMQARFVQDGIYIDYTPSTDVATGTIVVQGDLVGVAIRPIPANTLGALAVAGVFDIKKATTTIFNVGAKVFWDATNEVAVTTDGGGANKYLGKAIRAAGSGTTTVRVLLLQ
jgi:predicted RecA/RadA family phage recombinase